MFKWKVPMNIKQNNLFAYTSHTLTLLDSVSNLDGYYLGANWVFMQQLEVYNSCIEVENYGITTTWEGIFVTR